MIFWQWFAANGDKLFTFIALAAAAFQGQTDLPAWVMRAALIAGILATAAHQSFFPGNQFPNHPGPTAPKA